MEYMTYSYFNEIHDIKVCDHPKKAVAVPDREGMVECCLDRDRPFGFLVGRGGVFATA